MGMKSIKSIAFRSVIRLILNKPEDVLDELLEEGVEYTNIQVIEIEKTLRIISNLLFWDMGGYILFIIVGILKNENIITLRINPFLVVSAIAVGGIAIIIIGYFRLKKILSNK